MSLKLRIFFYKLPWSWYLIVPNTFLLIIPVIAFWYPTSEDKLSFRMSSEDYLTVVDNWKRIMMAKMSPHLALAVCNHLALQSFHSKWVIVITSSYGRNWADRRDILSKLTLLVTRQTGKQSRQLTAYLSLPVDHTTSLRNSWANDDAHIHKEEAFKRGL